MMFLANALEEGWSIRKSKDSYIFTKKHENKREIFQEDYLEKFVLTNSTNILGISSQVWAIYVYGNIQYIVKNYQVIQIYLGYLQL